MNKKLKILVSAYACNPLATPESYPGEAWDGWNQVKQLGRFHNLTVITWRYNKKALEDIVNKEKIKNMEFYYLELPKIFQLLKKNYFGIRIYYWIWQIVSFLLAIKLHRNSKFDVFNHVTFHNDWMPSYIGAYLDIPFIWGPLGGGQRIPKYFAGELKSKNRFEEVTRSIFQEFWRHTPTRIRGMRKAKAVLVCNEETKEKVKRFSKNIYHFPVNGISREDLRIVSSLESRVLSQEIKEKGKGNDRRRQTGDGIVVDSLQSPVASQETEDSGLKTENSFRVLYAGRFDPIKAIPLGVRAFAEFNKNYPDSVLEIIGDGPEKERINKEIEKEDIQKSVNLISWLSREELVKKMREANVFLFPSLRDGGGAVVVEAMASGIPVVCLDLAGPGFHIQNEWGIKIEAKNPDYVVKEMAKALERLYLDDKLRIQMGINARRRAEEYYLWDKLGDRLQSIYEQSLQSPVFSHESKTKR